MRGLRSRSVIDTFRNHLEELHSGVLPSAMSKGTLTIFHQSHNSELNCWELSSSRRARITRRTLPRCLSALSLYVEWWLTMLSPFEAMQSIGILIVSLTSTASILWIYVDNCLNAFSAIAFRLITKSSSWAIAALNSSYRSASSLPLENSRDIAPNKER